MVEVPVDITAKDITFLILCFILYHLSAFFLQKAIIILFADITNDATLHDNILQLHVVVCGAFFSLHRCRPTGRYPLSLEPPQTVTVR